MYERLLVDAERLKIDAWRHISAQLLSSGEAQSGLRRGKLEMNREELEPRSVATRTWL